MAVRFQPQALADAQAVQARQAQVEHQHVGRIGQGQRQAGAAVGGEVDAVALRFQQPGELGTQGQIVFDDQDAEAGGGHLRGSGVLSVPELA